MPSKFIYRQLWETGQGFESFLADRGLEKETDGERLQTIYNRDFKTSFGTPAPGFSSMLYGMKIANLAYVTKTQVRFFSLDPWVSVQLPEETNEAGVRYQQAAQVTASQDLL
jgi:helicase MOV-10